MQDSERFRRLGGLTGLMLFAVVWMLPAAAGMPPEAQRLAAVTLLMVVLWLTEALPVPVTSLLPLVAYPLMGIRTIGDVSGSYLDPTIFLFMGGFFLALGIEKWNLHHRIALHIVRVIGFGPRRIVFGFMAATAFLSMWISNTATTMLMLPIALALLSSIDLELSRMQPETSPDTARVSRQLGWSLMLGIAYAASIGGFSTPIGTPTNIVFLRFWEGSVQFADAPRISTAEWMLAFVPLSAALLVCAGLQLTWRMPPIPFAERFGRKFFDARLHELGRPRPQELAMLALFALTALLWVSRQPLAIGSVTVIPGWGPVLERWLLNGLHTSPEIAKAAPHDAIVAMGMAILSFCIPAGRDDTGRRVRLMDWETAQARMPWGMLLLIGGGFAVAEAFDSTGLAVWIGDLFEEHFHHAGTIPLVIGVCVLSTFLTEFATNVVIVNSLLPVLAAVAISLRIDPRLLLVPATIAASCGFMMPMATPPNAIVFSTGRVPMRKMMSAGLLLNLIGVVLITIATLTWFVPVFHVNMRTAPEWLPAPAVEIRDDSP